MALSSEAAVRSDSRARDCSSTSRNVQEQHRAQVLSAGSRALSSISQEGPPCLRYADRALACLATVGLVPIEAAPVQSCRLHKLDKQARLF